MTFPRRRFCGLRAPPSRSLRCRDAQPRRRVRAGRSVWSCPIRPAARPTLAPASWASGSRSGSASLSSSRTGPAPAPISRRRPSSTRRRTATRCCSQSPTNTINASLYQLAAVQLPARHHAGRGPHRAAAGARGQLRRAGQDARGVDHLRQGQSRQDQHRVVRHRHDQPSRDRAVQGDGRRRHGARALPRRRAHDHRPDRRRSPGRRSTPCRIRCPHIKCGSVRALALRPPRGHRPCPTFRSRAKPFRASR